MPKRDAAYIQGQREMIARAALECILEKGVAATSTRDICVAAGVSRGALYSYFKSREDLIAEAALMETVVVYEPTDNWLDYERLLLAGIDPIQSDQRHRRLLRAGFEFLAELILTEQTPTRIDQQWSISEDFFRSSLEAMQARGEIALPLGLDQTAELHAELIAGAQYLLLGNRRLDFEATRTRLLSSLAFTAGRAPDHLPQHDKPGRITRRVSNGE